MPTTYPKPPLFFPGLIATLLLKFGLHLVAIVNGYGLHRDEYLYLAEGHHPLWGYMEGPPIIGWVAGISQLVFGATVWAAKLPVLLVGLLSLWLVFQFVRELGGNKYAQLIAGAGWLLSPAFLGSNNLFQPVSFNQFCWLLTGLAWVRVINYQRPKDWYLLGGVVGLGLLTKYSIVFYLLGLAGGVLLTKERRFLANKYCWQAVGIALLMWSPNLWWQYSYGFPVASHMQELASTQLVNMSTADFLIPQFLVHFAGLFIWLPGLYWLFHSEKLRPYRSLAWAYVFLILLLLGFSGKAYYSFGAYASLFVAGGCFWADVLKNRSWLIILPLAVNFLVMPFALTVLPIETMKQYGVYVRDNYGLEPPLRWEDGSIRDLSQDYADMHGWEEMVAAVADFYHSLPPEAQAKCMIEGGHYGEAGALNFFRKKYHLPEAVSFHASFILWVPDSLDFDRQIIVDNYPQGPSDFFANLQRIDTVQAPYARETSYLHYRSEPTTDVRAVWTKHVQERKAEVLE